MQGIIGFTRRTSIHGTTSKAVAFKYIYITARNVLDQTKKLSHLFIVVCVETKTTVPEYLEICCFLSLREFRRIATKRNMKYSYISDM
jgi:hypothetical protein